MKDKTQKLITILSLLIGIISLCYAIHSGRQLQKENDEISSHELEYLLEFRKETIENFAKIEKRIEENAAN